MRSSLSHVEEAHTVGIGPKQNLIDHNFLKVRTCKNKKDESYSVNGGVGRKLCDESAGSEL